MSTGDDDRLPRPWPRYMTARVAADYSDTSPWTIRRHVRPCGRRGRTLVYAIEDVERWMRGAAVETATRPPMRANQEPRGSTESAASIARIRALGRARRDAAAVARDAGGVTG